MNKFDDNILEPGYKKEEVALYLSEYRALVHRNTDTKKFGRIKVWIPDLMVGQPADENSIWARPDNNHMGGRNIIGGDHQKFQGSFMVPVKGTWWWVKFENGDVNRCFYTRPCDMEHWVGPPENTMGREYQHKWTLLRTPQHRVILMSDDPEDARVEITGKKRIPESQELADYEYIKENTKEHVFKIPTNQKTILIDEREGHNKILFADEKDNYINIFSEEDHIFIHSMADTRIYAEKKLWIQSLEECFIKCFKNIYAHAEFNPEESSDDSGNIHILADKSIYMRAEEDVHISSGQDMYLNSEWDMFVLSEVDMWVESKRDGDFLFGRDLRVQAINDADLQSGGFWHQESGKDMHIYSKQDMYTKADANMDIKAVEILKQTSGQAMHMKAGTSLNADAVFNMNLKAGLSWNAQSSQYMNLSSSNDIRIGSGLVAIGASGTLALNGSNIAENSGETYSPGGASSAEAAADAGEAIDAIGSKEATDPDPAEKVEMTGDRNEKEEWKNKYNEETDWEGMKTEESDMTISGADFLKAFLEQAEKDQEERSKLP